MKRKAHEKFIELYGASSLSLAEIGKQVKVSKSTLSRWKKEYDLGVYTSAKGEQYSDKIGVVSYQQLNKWGKHEVEQKFIKEFASGKHSVEAMARKYKVGRQTVLKWKYKHFGKGNLRAELMYKMHIVGIPTRAIAEFYGVHIPQVHRSIRECRNNKPFKINEI